MLQTLGDARLPPIASPWDCHFVQFDRGSVRADVDFGAVGGCVACYSDRNISGQEVALETILRCSCFVVLVSKQMMSSELVRDPLAFAEGKGRPIVPVELNNLSLGLYKSYSLVPVPFTGVWN
ncbi:hypothetical protein PPTG_13108 [Phytophthora nicotianae INRA-310]|uniref:TIR domain-containing protein n=1 Tax=Phytophthora nicotianae (strain INRA-310) TaxID=761204 RepID=W2Q3Q1_PHYN3|nr:hypothetical protein PPTG_13108 [Phytophthora nicotianae INRA-310]ETN07803.1 hypothetical protein PPTG_13108 [Phytophthora nicotianae INRA-310]